MICDCDKPARSKVYYCSTSIKLYLPGLEGSLVVFSIELSELILAFHFPMCMLATDFRNSNTAYH